MGKWEMVRLGDVCEKKIATLPAGFTEKIIYIDISSVDNDLKKIISFQEINGEDAPSRAKQLLEENDILVSTVRPNLNAVALNTLKSSYTIVASTGYCVLRCKKNVDSRYIFHFCKAERFIGALVKVAKGASYPAVNNNDVKNVEIPLPPLDEQKRVAKNLDLASEIVKGYKEQLAELDKLVQSVFYEMFGDPVTNEKRWEKGKIRDVVMDVKYGISKPAIDGGKYKYLRMGNITYSGHLDLSDLKYIDISDSDLEKYIVRNGDVLFNRTNSKELVGKTCVFNVDEPMIIAGYIIRVRTNQLALPIYFSMFLNSSYGKKTLKNMCKSIIGQANINAQELQNISILIPPLPLQTRFAEIVTAIEAQKARVKQALAEAKNLFNSLMQEYFA